MKTGMIREGKLCLNLTAFLLVFLISACGGGGGSSSSSSSSSGTATTRKVPDTGQTTCYNAVGSVITCTGTGDDGSYTINAPSYTDNGNGTVTDNVTGMMWQKQDDGTTRTWATAGTYCPTLTLGGHSDWRLPSRMELITIVNLGMSSPAINATYFPNTKTAFHWSSTAYAGATADAWIVNFDDGYVTNYLKTNSRYVRCVRGQQTTQSFADNGNGTITDNVTGLMWQKQDDATTRTWDAAITYCEGLSLGGHTDWRLPNHKELSSIVDDTVYNPSINAAYFPGTQSNYYWSSTTRAVNTTYAWDVYFYGGNVFNHVKTASYYVRCVRLGQ